MPSAQPTTNTSACRACGELILWAEVFRDRKPVPLNLEPDQTGMFILLRMIAVPFVSRRMNSSAGKHSERMEFARTMQLRLGAFGTRGRPARIAFPVYSLEGAIRRELPSDFRERRERLRQLRLSLDRERDRLGRST